MNILIGQNQKTSHTRSWEGLFQYICINIFVNIPKTYQKWFWAIFLFNLLSFAVSFFFYQICCESHPDTVWFALPDGAKNRVSCFLSPTALLYFWWRKYCNSHDSGLFSLLPDPACRQICLLELYPSRPFMENHRKPLLQHVHFWNQQTTE